MCPVHNTIYFPYLIKYINLHELTSQTILCATPSSSFTFANNVVQRPKITYLKICFDKNIINQIDVFYGMDIISVIVRHFIK